MKRIKLSNNFDITKLIIDDSDYKKRSPEKLADITFELFLIRKFEETLLELSEQGCIHGPVHTSIGHEACATGVMSALKASDKILSTHRAHHHYLSKAVGYYGKADFNALKDNVNKSLQNDINSLMAEIMGLSIGCCGGRGGSMHLRNAEVGVIGTNAIVAGGVPLATGAAFAAKYDKNNDVVVSFLGDGAVNQGAFHEALNLAGIWKLPVIYFIENNLYAVGTSINNSTATSDLAVKASAYGVKGLVVDGMDPVAVCLATEQAAQDVRSGKGATLIEAKCYRFNHHAGPVAGSSYGYREKNEEENWICIDPHKIFPQKLIEMGIFTEAQIEIIRQKAIGLVKTALDFCTIKDGDKLQVKENLWPTPSTIKDGLRSNGQEFENINFSEKEDFEEFEQKTYVDAIASVTGRWLENDEKTFIVGEEIANFGGGPYGATKDLPSKYPDRVLNTPISECGFTGLAGGAAMSGMKPIVEIMFPDFALVAADQLFNQIGKLRHMYGNTTDMPIVVRTRVAIGCGYGGQHSMDPVGLFSLFSGWAIAAPSNAFDYIGLFNTAMISKNPVLILEHHELYPEKCDVPKDNLDYLVAFGKANILKQGSDVTVVSYSKMVVQCLKAVEHLENQGVSTELIALRTVSPADIDYDTIGQSLKKTGIIVVVEQAPKSQTIGSKITEQCQLRFFDYLDGPIVTISSLDIPNPVSKILEESTVPSLDYIQETIFNAAKRQI
jgi:2-oxoisovalerate dehydrogenase E1 component